MTTISSVRLSPVRREAVNSGRQASRPAEESVRFAAVRNPQSRVGKLISHSAILLGMVLGGLGTNSFVTSSALAQQSSPPPSPTTLVRTASSDVARTLAASTESSPAESGVSEAAQAGAEAASRVAQASGTANRPARGAATNGTANREGLTSTSDIQGTVERGTRTAAAAVKTQTEKNGKSLSSTPSGKPSAPSPAPAPNPALKGFQSFQDLKEHEESQRDMSGPTETLASALPWLSLVKGLEWRQDNMCEVDPLNGSQHVQDARELEENSRGEKPVTVTPANFQHRQDYNEYVENSRRDSVASRSNQGTEKPVSGEAPSSQRSSNLGNKGLADAGAEVSGRKGEY